MCSDFFNEDRKPPAGIRAAIDTIVLFGKWQDLRIDPVFRPHISIQLLSESHFVSPRIGIPWCILKILLCQPRGFLVILRNVNALDLENDRPRAVVTAGDHPQ